MKSWPYQYEENIFVRALSSGHDQEGADAGGPYTVGNVDDREMARWIDANVAREKNAILTDDAQGFGVMLATGRPDLFFDRIDPKSPIPIYDQIAAQVIFRVASGSLEVRELIPSVRVLAKDALESRTGQPASSIWKPSRAAGCSGSRGR